MKRQNFSWSGGPARPMPSETEESLRLEMGHVLFLDRVGHSKLRIEGQKDGLRQLTDVALAMAQVVRACCLRGFTDL